MRIDLCRPMAKGNLIVLKGKRNQGKSTLACSAIKQFVADSPQNHAIFVGMNKQLGEQLIQSLPVSSRSQVLALTIDHMSHSDSEFLLAPMLALHAASQHAKVLVVIDDVLKLKLKET